MSQLAGYIEDYLALRRALGFKLGKEGRFLPDFAAFTEAAGAATVTVDLAVRWAAQPQGTSPVWAAQRLSMVRGLARYLQAIDPATQVPPAGLLPARTRRATPYIYSDAEVTALMTAARMLPGGPHTTRWWRRAGHAAGAAARTPPGRWYQAGGLRPASRPPPRQHRPAAAECRGGCPCRGW